MIISSRSNPIVKSVRALALGKERRAQGLHVIEGEKLVSEALASNLPVASLFIEEGFRFAVPDGVTAYTVSRSVLEAITDSRTPQGIAATVHTPDTAPPAAYPDGLFVLLDGVQDPGNVGAIIRSADAFGAKAILLSGDCADAYAPKSLRAAMGSTYHLPVYQCEAAAALDALLSQGFTCICGHLRGSETLPTLKKRTVLVIGSEGNGVSEAVATRCVRYRLPMPGRAESLNASVAAGVLLYILSNTVTEA